MRTQHEKGFTLIELVVVIAVIGIMAAIAVPNFLNWLPNMRLKAAARDLYSAAMQAKGAAVKRNIYCALVFNQIVGGTTDAYIVYADSNKNCQYDGGEPILVQVTQWPKNVSLDPSMGGGDGLTFTNDNAGNPSIFFKPNAIPTSSTGGFANGSAFLQNTNAHKKKVVINRAGSISIQ